VCVCVCVCVLGYVCVGTCTAHDLMLGSMRLPSQVGYTYSYVHKRAYAFTCSHICEVILGSMRLPSQGCYTYSHVYKRTLTLMHSHTRKQVLDSMRLPGQGSYIYSAIVREYLDTIVHIAHNNSVSKAAQSVGED